MLIPILVVALIVVWAVTTYNKLISQREMVRNSMGQIASQVESRWDAISSLIGATKKYSDHEADLLGDITRNRAGISRDSGVLDVENDYSNFDNVLSRINLVVENYPDLKASSIYTNTMDKIDKYEDNVRHSRMIYNDTVTKYNRSILVFPTSILANLFNFKEEDYFKSTEPKKDMPSWD